MFGLVAGYGIAWTAGAYQLIPLDPQIYSVPFVPFDPNVFDALWIVAAALLISAASTLVPARYFVVVLRGIFLKGVGLDVLWRPGVAMIIYAFAGLGLAVHAFKKEIA